MQKFINAKSEQEIIFTRNTTESLNLVAYSYGLANLKPGDEIVTTIMEHHSNMLPWRMVAQQTGAVVKYIECAADGSISDEAIDAAITEKTKIVAMAEVSNVLGRLNPIAKAISVAHKVGAVAVIDAAQSAPHMAIDVQKMDADFLAFSGHKMLGPMGIGVLYGKKELLEAMPPFLSGGEMISFVSRDGQEYAPLPHKFEAGTVNAGGAVALAEAIRYLQKLGMSNVQQAEQELTEYLLRGMQDIPHIHVLGSEQAENHTGIVAFTVDQVHPHDISEILSSDGMDIRAGHHCAEPLHQYLGIHSSARASVMFYNTKEETARFLECVSNIRRRMGYGE